LAATLELAAGRGKLRYEAAYLNMPHARALDPMALRFSRKSAGIPILKDGGFPGVILDAMPAGYGADRLNARHARELSALELLELGPPDAVGAIEVCQDIERKLAWRPSALSDLVEHVVELEESAPSSRAIRRLLDDGMTSAGGERLCLEAGASRPARCRGGLSWRVLEIDRSNRQGADRRFGSRCYGARRRGYRVHDHLWQSPPRDAKFHDHPKRPRRSVL
jgi:hypothetical protein